MNKRLHKYLYGKCYTTKRGESKMLFITCVKVNPSMMDNAGEFGDKILKEPPEFGKEKHSFVSVLGDKIIKEVPKDIKFLHVYHTFGRYDAIWIYEAENPKIVEDFLHTTRDVSTTETWLAIDRKM
ncbi:MAG: hypothetical protein DNFNHJIP_00468 [Candidatus Argoarchaeum ethanivorans]|uniref:Uncharacterized protein n=1 Tax=Candidatus Argoarchaeum ethanivorans TaxID=2608793 RepID=A0A812A230_9EURY|nr:MAG: hypothetical protein DNFNHJIP_00468 [Candidatus Argoarchaeum ethanivorans]